MPNPNVDHVIDRKKRPDLAYDMTNLECLCASCHSRKTIHETMSKGKPLIGPDGFVVVE
jgi:5-methylcytosine-specific restriction endonuclease McrA